MAIFNYIDIHTHQDSVIENTLSIKNVHKDFHQYNSLFFYSAGIHPRYINIDTVSEDFIQMKNSLLSDHFLAVGECGLDRLSEIPFNTQEHIFIQHIQLANELAKPLIIHCVRAYREIIQLLKDFRINIPVIFHGFNNKYEIAQQILDEGYYLSIGKSIKNPFMQAIFTKLPAGKILMETDEGEMDIQTIYHHASQLRNTSLIEWQMQIRKNFSDIFPNLPA